jgi:hypothetical protein
MVEGRAASREIDMMQELTCVIGMSVVLLTG